MKKDVIYIDIEDDITSIIDKVKGADAPIVALVPPKRIGVLQSIVNLKLLQRAAKSADKRVVLITNDQALSALAAGVQMPVAKNLQSKPEVPEIAALDIDDEDVINGEELPVGDLAGTAPIAESTSAFTLPTLPPAGSIKSPGAAMAAAKNAPKKGGPKVPNFEIFRKHILLFAGGGVLLIALLVWAIVFAPHATVAITAKTNLVNINQQLTLVPNGTLDATQKVLPAVITQTKKTNSVDFDATGKKDVGEKASGTVHIRNCDSSSSFTIDAGTVFTASSGQKFTSSAAVAVPGLSGSASVCRVNGTGAGVANASVVAQASGPQYNIAPSDFSITGVSGDVYANNPAAMTGGTTKVVTVVSQGDIDKAKEQLAAGDANKVKDELKKQIKGDMIVIDESFKVDAGTPASSPGVDQEATRAKLTGETTYTLISVKRTDLKSVFNTYLKTQLGSTGDQKIYADGDEDTSFSQFQTIDSNFKVTVQADGQIGPKIDDTALKTELAGKRSGEIQQIVEDIQGVENVETKFSPFWVTKAPDAKKITIKFVLKNDSN